MNRYFVLYYFSTLNSMGIVMDTIISKLENSPANIIAGIIWTVYQIIADIFAVSASAN